MSQPHPHSQPILNSVAAHLYVRDLKVSAESSLRSSASPSTLSMAIRRSMDR